MSEEELNALAEKLWRFGWHGGDAKTPSYTLASLSPDHLETWRRVASMVLGQDATARVRALEDFARDVRDNYDCDPDAHRYGTRCRACEAAKVLPKEGP